MADITKVADVVGSAELVTEEVVKSSLGWILGGNLQTIHHHHSYYYINHHNMITNIIPPISSPASFPTSLPLTLYINNIIILLIKVQMIL